MSREEAVKLASKWWIKMMFSGVWDNGDQKTEDIHNVFKSWAPKLNPDDIPALEECFIKLYENVNNLYSDYGNYDIDKIFLEHGLPYTSKMHCPQKAGANLLQVRDGWAVETKSGYGQNYVRIYTNENAAK